MESNSKLYLLVLYIGFLAPFLLRGLTWAMLYVWTKNYPQVVGTCSGHHGQLISQNCVLTKIRAEPPPLSIYGLHPCSGYPSEQKHATTGAVTIPFGATPLNFFGALTKIYCLQKIIKRPPPLWRSLQLFGAPNGVFCTTKYFFLSRLDVKLGYGTICRKSYTFS